MTETNIEAKDRALRTIAVNGAYEASRSLSKWFKRGVRVMTDGFAEFSLEEMTALAGEPDETIIAAHMAVTGDLEGHLLMTMPQDTTFRLVDLLLDQPEGTTKIMGELEMSCVQETANILASTFMNNLSSGLRIHAEPTSPVCIQDMASAIIESTLTEQAMSTDKILLAKSDFLLDGFWINLGLFLIPTPESYRVITENCDSLARTDYALKTIAVNGAFKASRALSKWFRRGVRITTEGFEKTPISKVSESLLDDADQEVVALHMLLEGELRGHVLLSFPIETANSLVDVLLGQPKGTTTHLGEMEKSCLQETANILSSSFINSIAGWLGVSAIPGAPEFAMDMACAVLQPLLIEQAMVSDEILSTRTVFMMDGIWVDWTFLILPTPETMRLIEAHCS